MNLHSMTVITMFCACGCSTAAPEPNAKVNTGFHLATAQLVATDQLPSNALPGYVHSLGASRFKIGGAASLEVSIPTLQRWRGPLGAFGLDPTTGSTMGILDSNAPTGPYMLDDVAQGALVKKYFVGAGLPVDQIAVVGATYEVVGGGKIGEPVSQPIQLHAINSVLGRSVNGVRIAESYAAARMTTAGDVDWEAVFWPPIDMGIVNAAVAFASQMADPAQHAALVARLSSAVLHEGGVVIHHTTPAIHAAPRAFVSYDATIDPGGSATDRHFDQNGVEFRLPQEQSSTATPR